MLFDVSQKFLCNKAHVKGYSLTPCSSKLSDLQSITLEKML